MSKATSWAHLMCCPSCVRGYYARRCQVLGIEDEVGSIRSGKRADFVALSEDPFEVSEERLHEIHVVATIFEGAVHEVRPSRYG